MRAFCDRHDDERMRRFMRESLDGFDLELNRALGREGHVGALEYALSAIHWSWFLVPHGTLAYMLVGPITARNLKAVLMPAIDKALAGK